jgi:hypothetical protein
MSWRCFIEGKAGRRIGLEATPASIGSASQIDARNLQVQIGGQPATAIRDIPRDFVGGHFDVVALRQRVAIVGGGGLDFACEHLIADNVHPHIGSDDILLELRGAASSRSI